jgi:FkbM family methyltransferase
MRKLSVHNLVRSFRRLGVRRAPGPVGRFGKRVVQMLGRRFTVVGLREDRYLHNAQGTVNGMRGFFQVAASCVGKDSIALDIGANIGLTALALSTMARRVHCFEPDPNAFEALCLTLRENAIENCVPHNLAVSNRAGALDFAAVESSAGSHVVSDAHVAKAQTSTVKVKAASLDALAAEFPEIASATFVKIDAEGFEPYIIEGAQGFLSSGSRAVFMEFNAWCLLAHQRMNPFDFLETLAKRFEISVIRPDGSIVGFSGDAFGFMHEHIITHGCVDDLLLRPKV